MSSQRKLNMEEQLLQYRARKREAEKLEVRKKKLWDWIAWIMSFGYGRSTPQQTESDSSLTDSSFSDAKSDDKCEQIGREKGLRRRPGLCKESSSSDSQEFTQVSFIESYTCVDWVILGLKFFMWLLLFKIFILIEFGAVFFIFSAFVFIWYNMRSGPKRIGEVSAYSVFNPNCEKIDGTFTAEQFERELLHKM